MLMQQNITEMLIVVTGMSSEQKLTLQKKKKDCKNLYLHCSLINSLTD